MTEFTYELAEPYDLMATVAALPMGTGDPSLQRISDSQIALAMNTLGGPIALTISSQPGGVTATVEEGDAEWIEPLLADLLGVNFVVPAVGGPRRLRETAHAFRGMRLARWPNLFDRLLSIVLQQLISFRDACTGWRHLLREHGTPTANGLMSPPTPAALRKLTRDDLMACYIPPKHAQRVLELARYGSRIQKLWDGGRHRSVDNEVCQLLEKLPGIGPWTIAFVRGVAMADANAELVGDYSIGRQVVYFFEGVEDGSDDDMLRVLQPYEPHRYYVTQLVMQAGRPLPRRGPKRAPLRRRFR